MRSAVEMSEASMLAVHSRDITSSSHCQSDVGGTHPGGAMLHAEPVTVDPGNISLAASAHVRRFTGCRNRIVTVATTGRTRYLSG